MIIDSSVAMAILLREPDAERFERVIEASFEQRIPRRISAASILECEIVSRRRLGDLGSTKLDNLLTLLRAQVVPFDADQLRWAWIEHPLAVTTFISRTTKARSFA